MLRSHLIFCVLLIAGCLALLLTTRYYDRKYAAAHSAADYAASRPTAEVANRVATPSPQHYSNLAQLSAWAAVLLSLIALVNVVRTKHLLWVAGFVLCAIPATISLMTLKYY